MEQKKQEFSYWLQYSESLGYRIVEVGKTTQTIISFQTVGGSNSLDDLTNFVSTMNLIELWHTGLSIFTYNNIKSSFEQRFKRMEMNVFDNSDF